MESKLEFETSDWRRKYLSEADKVADIQHGIRFRPPVCYVLIIESDIVEDRDRDRDRERDSYGKEENERGPRRRTGLDSEIK